ncbi:MAG: hypothetical protein IT524_07380 [Nitrosomonas sp.]|nr:hypothetical protein [Nitrosomonas sp.]
MPDYHAAHVLFSGIFQANSAIREHLAVFDCSMISGDYKRVIPNPLIQALQSRVSHAQQHVHGTLRLFACSIAQQVTP